ncbi:hypothetical protein PIB30_097394, partial [Stylosanthes scabra]|nr:hypothetical protein [Stylosanthes scabra]
SLSNPSRRSSPIPHYSSRRSSSTRRVSSSFPAITSSSLRRIVAGKELRPPKSWELIPPSEGWMCEGDVEEKEIRGMEPSLDKEEEEKDLEEEEDDPEKEIPLLLCLWMWMQMRTIYSTWRSFSVIPSTLPSIVVMPQCGVCPEIHRIDFLVVMTHQVIIFLELGHRRHRVRVIRMPRLVST